tara:strand:+ start:907 stop:1269 length:363 start_codon:yes stop_codon:yes gene_type:complete
MCFAGGGSSQATQIDPSIQAQQEADKAKADAKTTEMKESAIQSSVAANKPLVASSSPTMTSMPTQSDANPFSGEFASDMVKQDTIDKRAKGTVLRRRKRSGRGSLFTGQGGGIGFYSKYR